MRRTRLFYFILIFLISFPAWSQWVQVPGPYGAAVSALVYGPDGAGGERLYVGTGCGVYCSSDGTNSWFASGLQRDATWSLDVVRDGKGQEGLYVCTNGEGVLRTTDGGENWVQMNTGLTNLNARCLALKDSILFLGTSGGGVFRSSDYGSTWTQVNSGLTSNSIRALAVRDSVLYAGTWGRGVFRSADNGDTWTPVNAGLSSTTYVTSLARVPAGGAGPNLLLGTVDGPLLRSTDDSSWTESDSGITTLGIRSLTVIDSTVFAGTYDQGLFCSTDRGTTWRHMGLAPHEVRSVLLYRDSLGEASMLAGTEIGVRRSEDGGMTWTLADSGLMNTSPSAVMAVRKNLFVSVPGSGLFLSSDSGANWIRPDTSRLSRNVNCFLLSDTNFIAGCAFGVLLSTDSGRSWTQHDSGLTDVAVLSLAAAPSMNILINKTYLYAGTTSGGVFLSTNNGGSWTPFNPDLPATDIFALTVIPEGESGWHLFAGSFTKGVFLLSTASGGHWTAANSGLTSIRINSLGVLGTTLYAGTLSGLFRSTDYGTSWAQMGFSGASVRSIAVSGNNVFVVGNQAVYLSSDSGATWNSITGDLPASPGDLALTDRELLVSSPGRGVWRRPLTDFVTGVDERPSVLPASCTLEQNYPNPFNPSTVIKYTVAGVGGQASGPSDRDSRSASGGPEPAASKVNLVVYDLLGREVKVLVNERKAPGSYQVTFDGNGLATGVYVYRLRAGSFVQSRRFLLLR